MHWVIVRVGIARQLEEVEIVEDSDPLKYGSDAAVSLVSEWHPEQHGGDNDARDVRVHRVDGLLGVFVELALHLVERHWQLAAVDHEATEEDARHETVDWGPTLFVEDTD